mmetsp:Transcript_17684/g.32371  ORF Transcript_17684/g.32371 Transcript_17684/m.32371 type:complete len:90 (-) Transcript_17684:48-317(-)
MTNQARLWNLFYKAKKKQLFHTNTRRNCPFMRVMEMDEEGRSTLLLRNHLIGKRNKSNPKSANRKGYIDSLDFKDELKNKATVVYDSIG